MPELSSSNSSPNSNGNKSSKPPSPAQPQAAGHSAAVSLPPEQPSPIRAHYKTEEELGVLAAAVERPTTRVLALVALADAELACGDRAAARA
ncbi:MAG: hypothetical protein J0H18_04420, partial [Rhizobiales bacterium]|nr:hypothetical protein [Hyphomicrobiales bacterium]